MQPLRECPVVSLEDNRSLYAAGRQWSLCFFYTTPQPEFVTSLRPPCHPTMQPSARTNTMYKQFSVCHLAVTATFMNLMISFTFVVPG